MSGKALLILVIGFTLIFVVMGYLWGNVATRSVNNHVSYYKNNIAHNIAVSGVNIGLRSIWEDPDWTAGISNRDFELGKMNVSISGTGADTFRTLTSVGTFMNVDKTVKVKLMLATYAKYAWFIPSVSTGSGNRAWITGDTVFGGFHSNQFLVVDGDPVFFGKVTTLKGIKDQANPGPSDPQFLGGYKSGVDVDWSKNMKFPNQAAAAQTGVDLGGDCKFSDVDLWLKFNGDGTVTYASKKNGGSDSTNYPERVTIPLTEMAPNGIIYTDKGDIYMSGTLNGEVTVVAEGSSGGGSGNIYLVGDMVYQTAPMLPQYDPVTGYINGYIENEASTDKLGILATNNIYVSTKGNLGGYENNVVDQDINIHGAIFCVSGGFTTEGLGASPANIPLGSIYLQGSMTAGKEEQVADFSGTTLVAGYNRHIVLDERFLVAPPLYFPYSDGYEIISWLE